MKKILFLLFFIAPTFCIFADKDLPTEAVVVKKNAKINEPEFAEIFGPVAKNRTSTAAYRVESKVETNVQNAADFISYAFEVLGSQIELSSDIPSVTMTDTRKIKSLGADGKEFRNAKIRIRAYRILKPDEGFKNTSDVANPNLVPEYVAPFDHKEGEVPVRFEFKIEALDANGVLIENVVEKPIIFCTKEQAETLLDPELFKQVASELKSEIMNLKKGSRLVNFAEDVDAMIEAIGKLHEKQISLKFPHESTYYMRERFVSPDDVQITRDANIHFIDYSKSVTEPVSFDFPETSRVVEFKVPIDIMQELRRLHALSTEELNRSLPGHRYEKYYKVWRKFEELPAVEGSKKGSGKGKRGKSTLKAAGKLGATCEVPLAEEQSAEGP